MLDKIPEKRLHYLCEIDGRLALNLGDYVLKNEPVRVWKFLVARSIKIADWPELPGNHLNMTTGDGRGYYGSLRLHGAFNPTYVDLNGGEIVELREAIPRPRNGKEYGWRWDGSHYPQEWVKENFPKCPECYKWHDPAFTVCPQCERCHRVGGKCPTSY